MANQPNIYNDIIQVFLNNIRMYVHLFFSTRPSPPLTIFFLHQADTQRDSDSALKGFSS
jgi:hypothetical protein